MPPLRNPPKLPELRPMLPPPKLDELRATLPLQLRNALELLRNVLGLLLNVGLGLLWNVAPGVPRKLLGLLRKVLGLLRNVGLGVPREKLELLGTPAAVPARAPPGLLRVTPPESPRKAPGLP